MVEATIGAGGGSTPDTDEVDLANRSVRRGSLIAGLALLVMTPLAAYANFGVLEALVTSGDAALILVGLHLVLLGYLVYRSGAVPSYQSGHVPKVLGVLLAIAGVGYVIDSFGDV